jgi:hypothetical protein
MRKIQGILFALTLAIASMAHAQATRTWVSGVGDDANPCSRTAPCKTFAGAISKTANGGIINAIDSAGFGAVTITKSITIDASPFMGGVLAAGTNGIIVSATSVDKVNLRGLDIEGVSAAIDGVKVNTAATVTVENCQIYGYSKGIDVTGTVSLNLSVINCTIRNNSNGIFSSPSAGTTKINVENSRIVHNTINGYISGVNTDLSMTRSNVSLNGGTGVRIEQATSAAVESTTLAANARGIECGVSAAATCTVSRCLIVKNTAFGVTRAGDGTGATGTLTGFQNNVIVTNASGNAVSGSTAQQ